MATASSIPNRKQKPEPETICISDSEDGSTPPAKRQHLSDNLSNKDAGTLVLLPVPENLANVKLSTAAGKPQHPSSTAANGGIQASSGAFKTHHVKVESEAAGAGESSKVDRKGGDAMYDRSTAELLSSLTKQRPPPRDDSRRQLSEDGDSQPADSTRDEQGEGDRRLALGRCGSGGAAHSAPRRLMSDLLQRGTPLDPQGVLAEQLLTAACLGEDRARTVMGMRMTGRMASAWQLLLDLAIHKHRQPAAKGKKGKRDEDDAAPKDVTQQLMELIMPNTHALLTMMESEVGKTLYELQQMNAHNAQEALDDCIVHIQKQLASKIIAAVSENLGKDETELTLVEVLENMPADLPVDPRLQKYEVGQEDARVALRGEYGVMVMQHVNPCTVLGPYAGFYMLPSEYSNFQQKSPFSLLCSMLENLQGCEEEEVHLPGVLTQPLADLMYQEDEGLGAQAIRRLLSCCTTLVQLAAGPSRGRRKPGVGQLYAVAPKARLIEQVQELMHAELRKLAEAEQMDLPDDLTLDAQELKEELKAWRNVSEAAWTLTCDSYGADISVDKLGKTGQDNLVDMLRSAQDVVWKGKRRGGSDRTLEWLDQLHPGSDLTASAILLHSNEMAFINDPALVLPRAVDDHAVYDHEASQANCFLIIIQVAGWPFPFLITRKELNVNDPCSYAYDRAYWQVVFRQKDQLDLHRKVLKLSIALRKAQTEQSSLLQLGSAHHQTLDTSMDAQRSMDQYHATGTAVPCRHLSATLEGHPSGTASAHVQHRMMCGGAGGTRVAGGQATGAHPPTPTSPAPRASTDAHSEQEAMSTPRLPHNPARTDLPQGGASTHSGPTTQPGCMAPPAHHPHHHTAHQNGGPPVQGVHDGRQPYAGASHTYPAPGQQAYPSTGHQPPAASQDSMPVPPGAHHTQYNNHHALQVVPGCGWGQQPTWPYTASSNAQAVEVRGPSSVELLNQLFN